MNWDRIEGNWEQYKGKVKEQWGKLTYVNLQVIAGKRDQLVGKIENAYGVSRYEAERQLEDWELRNQRLFEETAKPH
jgi:uncharacterized protein YjbJ (UPF0337 family)